MGRRKHHKVTQFPQEIVDLTNKLLVNGWTYDAITARLNEMGHPIGKSSVGRYGKDHLADLDRVNISIGQAKAIVAEAGGKGALDLEEAAAIIALQKALTYLLELDSMQGEKATEVMKTIARLQSSGVQREKLKMVLKEKVQKTADQVVSVAKAHGLSDDKAEDIRNKIMGIST